MTTSGVEPGRLPRHRLAAQVAGVRRPARPLAHRGHRVVQADARADVRLLPLVLQRVEEVLVADQVRGERLDGQVAFAQRAEHQREVELLQVAQPAVHGLAGARGGADGEVAGLQQHHRQPAGGRVQGHAGTGDAAADHHQVVRPGGGGGDRVLAASTARASRSLLLSPWVASAARVCHSGLAASSSSIWWCEAGVVERAVRVVRAPPRPPGWSTARRRGRSPRASAPASTAPRAPTSGVRASTSGTSSTSANTFIQFDDLLPPPVTTIRPLRPAASKQCRAV